MPAKANKQNKEQETVTRLTLIGIFLSLFGAFSLRAQLIDDDQELRPLELALLGLATFRGGRLIAYDKVTETLRAPFTVTKEDEYGAGEMVVEKGTGARRVLGELLSCPTCIGTWVGAGLVYGMRIAPRPTRLFVAILGVTGLAELLNATVEALTWSSQAERKQSAPSK